MDNYEFEEFMKILKWEIQKYTVNQKMNGKEINNFLMHLFKKIKMYMINLT